MGLILRHFAILLAAAVLTVYSCKSESSRPMERDMTARMAERGAEEIGIGKCIVVLITELVKKEIHYKAILHFMMI